MSKERRLDESFDYASYLARCLENALEDIVLVSESAWLVIAMFTVFFYSYSTLLEHNYFVLPWIWIGIFFMNIAMNILFRYHLSQVVDRLGASQESLHM
jgi:divalent metal cation (Fe/Co/Zn/Cd) transporter